MKQSPQYPQQHTGLALSVRQPYVEQILRGVKRHELRSRATHVRGRVWLYASLHGNATGDGLTRGAIIGEACIVDCIAGGPLGWRWALAHPVRYPHPLAFAGQPLPVFWRPVVTRT